MSKKETFRKGRWAKVGMSYEMYGYVNVPIPDDIDVYDDYAIQEYLEEHLDEIKLPDNAEYVGDSAQLDMEFCEIKTPPKEEE